MTFHSQGTLAISVARLPDPTGSLLMLEGVWHLTPKQATVNRVLIRTTRTPATLAPLVHYALHTLTAGRLLPVG